MTVQTETNVAIFEGNGVADEFDYAFRVLDAAHLVVEQLSATTGLVTKTYTAGEYTVSGIGLNAGSVTLLAGALSADYHLRVTRTVPYTQDLDIVNQGGFYPQTVEDQLDLTVMGLQQVGDQVGRALLVPPGEEGYTLPQASDRAGLFPVFDAGGDLTVTAGMGSDGALRADLAGIGGTSLVASIFGGTMREYLESGAWVIPWDELGTADDGAVIMAAYALASAGGYPALVVPFVDCTIVTPLVFAEHGPDVHFLQTTLQAGANNMTVMQIDRSSPVNRLRNFQIDGFTISLAGRTGCKGLYTKWLVSTVMERVEIIGDEYPTFTANNVGWDSEGDQYSTFRDIKIERLTCCHYFHDGGTSVGGGINNNFDNVHFALCKFGSVQAATSINPMGYNDWRNIRVQASTHCGLYINNVQAQTFTCLTPEACTGSGTAVFMGHTIKAGHIHATIDTQARFVDYSHVSNDATDVVTADTRSRLAFINSTGAMIRTTADRTSMIEWEGTWGHGSQFDRARVIPQHIQSSRSLVVTGPANLVVDGSFPTAADTQTPVPGYASNVWGLAAGPTINGDPGLVAYQSVTFGAGVGGAASNAVRVAMTAGSTLDRTKLCAAAILLRSSVDADYNVTFSNMAAGGTVSLKAGEWTRVALVNGFFTGTTFGYFDIWPVAAGGPTLDFCYPTLAQDLSAQNFERFFREHVFNPRDPKGAVYAAAAAPVAGTWQRGAIVWNSAPAAGGVPGWVCVAAGTPGTWKAMAALAV